MLTLRPFILTFVPQQIFQRKLHQVLNASALSGPLHPVVIQLLVQDTLCSRHVNLILEERWSACKSLRGIKDSTSISLSSCSLEGGGGLLAPLRPPPRPPPPLLPLLTPHPPLLPSHLPPRLPLPPIIGRRTPSPILRPFLASLLMPDPPQRLLSANW